MTPREWYEAFPATMPIEPPFSLLSIYVRTDAHISKGPDHIIVGVQLVIDLEDGSPVRMTPAMTAAQARRLATALVEAADIAESSTVFVDRDEPAAQAPVMDRLRTSATSYSPSSASTPSPSPTRPKPKPTPTTDQPPDGQPRHTRQPPNPQPPPPPATLSPCGGLVGVVFACVCVYPLTPQP